MKFLIGNPAEIKRQLDAQFIGQWTSVEIVAIFRTAIGEPIMLVQIQESGYDK